MLFLFAAIGAVLLGFGVYVEQQNSAAAAASSDPGGLSATGDDPGAIDTSVPMIAAPVIDYGGGMPIIDPSDRSTWPSGDAIWRFCQAVASAEGYGASPANAPTSHHNPGDLGPGDTGYPGESHGGSVVSLMPDDMTGWDALYQKWSRIFAGQSSAYPNTLTIVQAAQKYAGDWTNWSRNVANDLGVSVNVRLIDWYRTQ